MARFDVWSAWFHDTFRTTFGFDYREHPFDHRRKSVRFASTKLRLLILRQEDNHLFRQAELGWLLDKSDVGLRVVNDAASQGYATAYQKFLASFSAPSSWLDEFYETDVIRHFYSEAERDLCRARWGKKRGSAVGMLSNIEGAVPANRTTNATTDEPSRKLACLSMQKTGSTALASALRVAGHGEVAQIHFLDPKSRQQRRREAVLATAFAKHLDVPEIKFDIVTSVRDPIARWISLAFHQEIEVLGSTGLSVLTNAKSFIEWVEAEDLRESESAWFDLSLKIPFDFDFRHHCFDFRQRSLRFVSERLRLLILRQEDPIESREAELGWLVGRQTVAIPRENESSIRFPNRYRTFVDAFVAPTSWLDDVYEREVVRHFYSDEERAAFRAHWSRPRLSC